MKKGGWIIGVLLFLVACTNTDVKEKTVSEENPVNEVTSFQKGVPLFFKYIQQNNPAFSADSFLLTQSAKQDIYPSSTINEQHVAPFKDLLIYNADSSKAIDLFSYNYIITDKTGVIKAEAAEPDTEVALINFKDSTRKRIWFSGPMAIILDAAWINPNEIIVAGMQENENGKYYPVIWKILLAEKIIDTYTYNHAVEILPNDYLNERFKTVKFH